MSSAETSWEITNQQWLVLELDRVRAMLQQHVDRTGAMLVDEPTHDSALATLGALFGLTQFERDMLMLCAGVELDGSLAALVSEAQGGTFHAPSFGLALAALHGAHWDALSPARPLRRWKLIEVGPGVALTNSPLRVCEPVLHALAGSPALDERLLRLAEHVQPAEHLVASHEELAARITAHWRLDHNRRIPLVQLCGVGYHSARSIAAAAAAELGLALHALPAAMLPANIADIETLAVLWERDALLVGSALLIEFDEGDHASEEQARAALRFAEHVGGLTVIAARERKQLRRAHVLFDIERPQPHEQRALWSNMLAQPDHAVVEQIAAQFNMSAEAIAAVAQSASVRATAEASVSPANMHRMLWAACRTHARGQLDDLAQRITPVATMDDLVLPDQQRAVVHDIAAHVRQRTTVYERWGMGGQHARGMGISALFAGPSGTGKTTAAEALANKLELDLYRIDLSGVVSKYIGETEKNLRRIFDAAEESGALLLFDEADAIFGKRSEVKDSHDRYANIEVGYLLQRMESYRGLVILTTNLKHAIDGAFLRRIRFVVQFPFPDAAQRAEIWRRMFPPTVPTAGLMFDQLARLNVAGGNIRTIALNAAFIAAEAGELLGMRHILRAAKIEYAKLEKPLTESEIFGWV